MKPEVLLEMIYLAIAISRVNTVMYHMQAAEAVGGWGRVVCGWWLGFVKRGGGGGWAERCPPPPQISNPVTSLTRGTFIAILAQL